MAPTGIFNSHLIMAACVERHGTEEQKQRYLPRFATGELRGGIGLTEPNAGTDLQGIRTVARRDGDDYVINGTKTWITNGIYGTCFAVLAKTDPEAQPRHKGMSMFIAEKGPGFTVGRKIRKLGYSAIDSAELVFEDYRVNADQLVGGVEGRGFHHAVGGLELGRINVAARGVGHRDGRAQGRPRATRSSARPSASRSPSTRRSSSSWPTWPRASRRRGCSIEQAARKYDTGERCDLEAGMAKLFASESRRREQPGGDAHLRRLQLLGGLRRRALLPRRAADVHRRGHQRDAAHHHRAPAGRAEPGVTSGTCPSPASAC